MHGSDAVSSCSTPSRSTEGDARSGYRCEHLASVTLDGHLRPSPDDFAAGIEEKCRPLNAAAHFPVEISLNDNAEGIAQFRIDVGDQWKRNLIAGFEALMRFNRVAAHAHDLHAFFREPREGVTKL